MVNQVATRSYRKKRTSLQVQFASIHALFMRELLTRFGKFRLGYVWVLLEPALHIGFMLILFGSILQRTVPNMPYALFLINGILPWFMFSKAATRALGAVEANKGLFNYRAVIPLDTVIVRTLLEAIIYFFAYVFFMLVLAYMQYDINLSKIPQILLAWLFVILFSFGFSCVMMVLGHWSAEAGKFVTIFIRILYIVSGVMFSVHSIPEPYQSYLLWNPLLVCIEMMRSAAYAGYPASHLDFIHLGLSTTIVLFVGLLMYKWREKAMLTS